MSENPISPQEIERLTELAKPHNIGWDGLEERFVFDMLPRLLYWREESRKHNGALSDENFKLQQKIQDNLHTIECLGNQIADMDKAGLDDVTDTDEDRFEAWWNASHHPNGKALLRKAFMAGIRSTQSPKENP